MRNSEINRRKREPSPCVLGIDPGTGKLGWAVLEKNKELRIKNQGEIQLLDCGLIETPANTPLADRLELIFNELQKVIKKYKPDAMAIEELFFVKNVKTGISVAHARGVAMLCGKQGSMDIFEYKPNEIKLGIAGFGHATKEQIIKMLKLHLPGCSIKQDDTADAVAVALYHLQVQKLPNSPEKSPELAPEKEKILYKDLSYKVVGVLYDCFKQLGGELQERYYQSLAKEEFRRQGLQFEDQKKLAIKGLPSYMGRYFPDFLIDDKIILELKVGSRVKKQDINQVMNYLRQSRKQLAIIALFSQNGVDTRRLLLGFSGELSGK